MTEGLPPSVVKLRQREMSNASHLTKGVSCGRPMVAPTCNYRRRIISAPTFFPLALIFNLGMSRTPSPAMCAVSMRRFCGHGTPCPYDNSHKICGISVDGFPKLYPQFRIPTSAFRINQRSSGTYSPVILAAILLSESKEI